MPSLAIYKNNLLQKGHTVGQSLRSNQMILWKGLGGMTRSLKWRTYTIIIMML